MRARAYGGPRARTAPSSRSPSHRRDALEAREVARHRHAAERGEERDDSGDLRRVAFEERGAIGGEHPRQVRDRAPYEGEPIRSRDRRHAWLEGERCPLSGEAVEIRITQVGQVGRDDVDALGDRREEIAFPEVDM